MENEQELRSIIEEFVENLLSVFRETVPEVVEPEEGGKLSKRTLIELASHEGAVREAYKDAVEDGVWTWGIGVTNASGHTVYPRYKDQPQSLSKVIEIYEWLVRTKYLPDVEEAFEGHELNEAQLAAALSFHYNTGAIKRASWVKSFKAGNISQAKREFMNWKSPSEIIPRRTKERDLFFDGVWSNKGTINVYEQVRKPSYLPKWSSLKQVDIEQELS